MTTGDLLGEKGKNLEMLSVSDKLGIDKMKKICAKKDSLCYFCFVKLNVCMQAQEMNPISIEINYSNK